MKPLFFFNTGKFTIKMTIMNDKMGQKPHFFVYLL